MTPWKIPALEEAVKLAMRDHRPLTGTFSFESARRRERTRAMTFTVSKAQEAKILEWQVSHRQRWHYAEEPDDRHGLRYTFSPTGIGDGLLVECTCNRGAPAFDATDLDSW